MRDSADGFIALVIIWLEEIGYSGVAKLHLLVK
jgi:hypothetical protein